MVHTWTCDTVLPINKPKWHLNANLQHTTATGFKMHGNKWLKYKIFIWKFNKNENVNVTLNIVYVQATFIHIVCKKISNIDQ